MGFCSKMNIAILIQAAEYLERRERGTVLFNYYFEFCLKQHHHPTRVSTRVKSERYIYIFLSVLKIRIYFARLLPKIIFLPRTKI